MSGIDRIKEKQDKGQFVPRVDQIGTEVVDARGGVQNNIDAILAPIEAVNNLRNIGDFIIHTSPEGTLLVTICTKVNSFVQYHQVSVTPVIETFTQATFPPELQRNEYLMSLLKLGALRELKDAGFTGNLAEIDPDANYSARASELIDQQLAGENFKDEDGLYYIARALTAKGLLDPDSRDEVIKSATKLGEKDSIITIVPSAVTQAMYGDDKAKQTIFEKGKEWATGEDRRFVKTIGGWSMLAASANTPQERREAYDIVMQNNSKTNYIPLAGSFPIAAAMVANEEQRKEIFTLASEGKDANSWEIQGGNIVAMAIIASEGHERTQVFQLARQKLAKGGMHIGSKFHLIAMALSAQTQMEKAETLSVLEMYASDTKRWGHVMIGWANIALGILGSRENERGLAVKSVAAAMESSR